MKKVQVLLSTYNGSKYLRQQLESILKQKRVNISILIRDDGSQDDSKNILEEYVQLYPSKIKVLYENNIGVKKSFLRLIQLADDDMDYYALSDQDDIWEEDKLFCATQKLSNNNIPQVYGSNVNLYYGEYVKEGEWRYNKPLVLGNFLVKNYFPGCTIVFNKKIRELVLVVPYENLNSFPLHDHWLCLICTSCGGEILYENIPHIKYRQHSSNVVGYDRGIINKIVQNGFLTNERRRYAITCELHNYYSEYFDTKSCELIKKIINYNFSFRNRIKFFLDKRIDSCNIFQNFILKLTILLNKF